MAHLKIGNPFKGCVAGERARGGAAGATGDAAGAGAGTRRALGGWGQKDGGQHQK